MGDDIQRYAYIGHALAVELMRRHQIGQTASAQALERSVLALVAVQPSGGFRQFISENGSTRK